MTDQIVQESPDALVILHALEKLRAGEGLTRQHLRNRRLESNSLLGLTCVRRYSQVHNVGPPEALIAYASACVRRRLQGTHQIVADTVLALDIFSEEYEAAGIEPRVISALHSNLLGRRRSALLSHWQSLHDALALQSGEPPSDRGFRATIEPDALLELARQLIQPEQYSFDLIGFAKDSAQESTAHGSHSHGRVIVLGGAVMDAKFRTKELPQRRRSSEASDFRLEPGGKGLWQTVAATRLGLEVSLVAAVPNDSYGEEIVAFMREQGVDISLLKRINDARTPFTGVIEFELGDSLAVNWRNEPAVHLDVRHIDQLAGQFAKCDAVLITFEIPRATLEHVLALLNGLEKRPTVIVTPGQPYSDALSGKALSEIDYLIAHAWELERYAPQAGRAPGDDLAALAAQELIADGVETICILDRGFVYTSALGTLTMPTLSRTYLESSLARDAFCAALAAKLIEQDGQFDANIALWAAAAASAAVADHPLPNPMPDRERVDQVLERSRFRLTPRTSSVGGALAAGPEAKRPPSLP